MGGGFLGSHCSPPYPRTSLKAPFRATLDTSSRLHRQNREVGGSEGPAEPTAACRGQPCPSRPEAAGGLAFPALGGPAGPSRQVLLLHSCWESLQESRSSVRQTQSPPPPPLLLELRPCSREAPRPAASESQVTPRPSVYTAEGVGRRRRKA